MGCGLKTGHGGGGLKGEGRGVGGGLRWRRITPTYPSNPLGTSCLVTT